MVVALMDVFRRMWCWIVGHDLIIGPIHVTTGHYLSGEAPRHMLLSKAMHCRRCGYVETWGPDSEV